MSYALDVAGTNSANRVPDEYAFVSPGRELKEPALIIPRAAPFFGSNLDIYTGKMQTGRRLIQGQDYLLLNPFVPIEQLYTAEFFYGIWIINPEVTLDLWLSYNTLGGDFALNEEKIFEELLGLMTNQIYFDWNQITNKPTAYPTRFHTHKESEEPIPQLVGKFQNMLTTIGTALNIPVDTTPPGV